MFVSVLLFASCNDHTEEIAECIQCDTLINLKVNFEDTSAVANGDTVTYILKKSPHFLPITRFVVLQNGQKSLVIHDTINMSDSIIIIHRGTKHKYYEFKRDWYVTANMFDHMAGFCGLHDYFIDGTEVNQSGTALSFHK